MKNKKENGFTLIELLAVIIILGILMIVAIPSVSKFINSSRKNGYVSVAKNITGGARNKIHEGKLEFSDLDTTYYIEGSCVNTENDYKSPYGDFKKTYVVVTSSDKDHDYYWMGVDNTGTGVKTLKNIDDLNSDDIENDIKDDEITPTIGIGKRSKIVVVGGENCTESDPVEASQIMNSITGRLKDACPSTYTETIYWALQDTDSDGVNDKLILSDSEVEGALSGNIPGNSVYTSFRLPPWIGTNQPYLSGNLSHNVSQVEIIGKVAPTTLAFYFSGIGVGAQSVNLDFNNLETCHVTSLKGTFAGVGGSSPSVRLDIRDWDTSKVTEMYGTFNEFGVSSSTCVIDGLEYLDTSKVTDMTAALCGACPSIPTVNLDLSRWDTSNVTNMNSTLMGLGFESNSVNLNLSNWKTSKVTNMSSLFSSVGQESSSVTINISNWDTSKVTNMSNMFAYVGVEASSWNIKGLKDLNTSSVKNMNSMFVSAGYNVPNFNLDLSGWNTSKVTNMSNMFIYVGSESSTVNLNISGWNTSNVTSMRNMFSDIGVNADTVNVIIPKTNGNSIENTTAKLYGKTTNASASLPNGKLFTLAE